MDSDITAADALTLSRINAQTQRDGLMVAKETAAASLAGLALTADQQVWTAEQAAEFKREVILALIPKYMTTSTNTTPAGAASDAVADCMRLKAALEEIMKL